MHKVEAKKRPGGEERSRREMRTRAASAQHLAAAARKSWEIRREAGRRQVLATQYKVVFKEINQVPILLTCPQDSGFIYGDRWRCGITET